MRDCIVCGRTFRNRRSERMCSTECRQQNERNKAEIKKRMRKKVNHSDLITIAKEAKDVGMSYGEYVAQQHAPRLERGRII